MTSHTLAARHRSRQFAIAAMLPIILGSTVSLAESSASDARAQVSPAELNESLRLVREHIEPGSNPAASSDGRAKLNAAAVALERWAALSPATPASRSQALAAAAHARLATDNASAAIVDARRSLLLDPLNALANATLVQSRDGLFKVNKGAQQTSHASSQDFFEKHQSSTASATPLADDVLNERKPTIAFTARSLLARLPSSFFPAAASLLLVAASILAGLRLSFGSHPARTGSIRFTFTPPLLLASIGCGLVALAVFNQWPLIINHDAVVTASGALGRSFPDYSSVEAAQPNTVVQGTEVRVLESTTQNNERWLRVWNMQTPASAPFWIPADTVEPVSPRSWAWRWLSESSGE